MKTIPRTLVLLAILGGVSIGWHVVRHREQVRLQAENESLRARLAVRAATAAPLPEPTSAAPAEDQRELLQLRGEVAQLLRAVAEATNELAAVAARPAPASPRRPSDPAAEARAEASRQAVSNHFQRPHFLRAGRIAGKLREFRASHGSELPSDLGQLGLPELEDEFEWMRTNAVPANEVEFTLVVRGRDAEQLPDGQWIRSYVLANGAMTMAGPMETPDWPAWERFHRGMAIEEARRRAPAAPSPSPSP